MKSSSFNNFSDLTELQNKIQRLEFHVKKLTDELEEMRKSLDLADELTLQLTKDNSRLTESVKRYNFTWDVAYA